MTNGTSERPSRDRSLETMSLRLPSVVGVVLTAIGLLTTSLVTAGIAAARLTELERRGAEIEDRLKEVEKAGYTLRDLQNGQTALRERFDTAHEEWTTIRDAQEKQGELVKMMCINVNFQAHAGLSCWGKK